MAFGTVYSEFSLVNILVASETFFAGFGKNQIFVAGRALLPSMFAFERKPGLVMIKTVSGVEFPVVGIMTEIAL